MSEAATESGNGRSDDGRSAIERLLGVFTDVKMGEGSSALLLTLNVFLLLTSYYIIKPVRDALIIAMPNGPEYKSYMGGAIAVALLFAVPAYVAFAKKLPRNRLVVGATLFFVSHILVFAVGIRLPGSEAWLPLAFYLWVGIFNMMVVAQFWAFANDIYNEEQGKRLFALVGIGASAGAAVGGALAKWLPIRPAASLEGGCNAVTKQVGYLTTTQLLILSAVLLSLCALLSQIVHARETRAKSVATQGKQEDAGATGDGAALEKAIAGAKAAERRGDGEQVKAQQDGAFAMVYKYRYLTLLAAFSLLFTLVNTNGEYMVGKLVKGFVFDAVGQCEFPNETVKKAFISGMFTSWYGDFYFYVNIAGVVLQSFAVSRLVKWGGLKLTFFVLPVIALFGAVAVLIFPLLSVLRPSKIAENSTDYSVNNTVRQMLWLPTTRSMKYQAKQAVDTFFVRMGDVGSALLVFTMASVLSISDIRIFAATNAVLVVVWLVLAARILNEQKVLKKMRDSGEWPDDDPEPAKG